MRDSIDKNRKNSPSGRSQKMPLVIDNSGSLSKTKKLVDNN